MSIMGLLKILPMFSLGLSKADGAPTSVELSFAVAQGRQEARYILDWL